MTLLDLYPGPVSVRQTFESEDGHPQGRTLALVDPPPSTDPRAKPHSRLSLAAFVGNQFVHDHVERKSFAGRKHYQAMLKHILRPETVDTFFTHSTDARMRLKAIPGWPYLDDVEVCQIAPEHVHDLTAAAVAQGYSPQTVKHIRNVLGAIISHARRKMLFAGENPAFAVELPPLRARQAHKLTICEAKSILRSMQYPEREIALITITTGMSIQEICGMQWKHVNLTSAPVDCDGTTVLPGHIFVTQHWNPEGIVSLAANRSRLVEVSQPLGRVLQDLKMETQFAGAENYVLATSSGFPICPASLRMLRLKPIGRKLDMPWLSWQVLKGAHETLLSELRHQLDNDLVLSVNIIPSQEKRNTPPIHKDYRA